MIDFIPEASSAPPAVRRRYQWRALVCMLVFVAAFLTAMLFSTREAGLLPVLALAGGGAAGLAGFTYEFVRLIRSLDELQQRIQITALAIGLGAATILLTGLGMIAALVETAVWARVAVLAAALAMPAGSAGYLIALHVVKRRYA